MPAEPQGQGDVASGSALAPGGDERGAAWGPEREDAKGKGPERAEPREGFQQEKDAAGAVYLDRRRTAGGGDAPQRL